MMCEDTLKIKNLPRELTDPEKEDFLTHFGATKIKVITSKSKEKSTVYARFETKEQAREVLFRLHQTYILKNRLSVEYADQEIGLPQIKKVETDTTSSKEYFKTFISKLTAFNHSVDFQQPPPPNLKYLYPKANRPTINNIGHALATVPKFYTQVLHLMNRMNLPPPFAVEAVRAPPPAQRIPPPAKPPESSSESELESDEESKQSKDVIPQKRSMPQKKMAKRPKFIKPPVAAPNTSAGVKGEMTENVFEKAEIQVVKKIEMKVSSSALEPKATGEDEIIGVIPSNATAAAGREEKEEPVISLLKLQTNQILAKDLDVLPVFKNYHSGAPSCRLYVKNISKNVELKDLEYIYNRYKCVEETKGKPSNFDIRLMQEGRMKGQAFVTLDTVEIAQKALTETNAYILKDKPLVVVFAKTPTKK